MSARRQARGRNADPALEIEGVAVPSALLNGDDPMWRDRDRYFAWLGEHGLGSKPAGDRIELAEWLGGSGGAHPANRRNLAAEEWAEANGVALEPGSNPPRASWHVLRRLGLID